MFWPMAKMPPMIATMPMTTAVQPRDPDLVLGGRPRPA